MTLSGDSSFGFAPTPLGAVLVITADDEVHGLYFDGHERTPDVGGLVERESLALTTARRQLAEYFEGTRSVFDLPVRLEGTPFQLEVWAALRRIPFGTVATYGEIARKLGRPEAARAVGAANGRNPISIVVPCHRLVGAGGGLTGYGWGIDRKRWLLDHEREIAAAGAIAG
jgi:methylated-DNA-[protein]-cysteine S-methyltransferase